ncbi:hypothetical protein F2Q70_00021823 [Brassica cretica]|uniref:Uncharacterized protein n=2 Tax=Brassica cretica TaxID=69181 RepID=A0A8S9GQV8_BRACR|nr:hypothetical protein F2Q70_00021823 [Brassica cretica]KAF2558055.1 hypothetical protein F2Q68_00015561 [Brassica cretica]KAF3611512.1 hypothetical protein DY000_02048167 [Brassica cretica]
MRSTCSKATWLRLWTPKKPGVVSQGGVEGFRRGLRLDPLSAAVRRVQERPRGKAPWLKKVEMLRAGEETTKRPREAMAVELRMKVVLG